MEKCSAERNRYPHHKYMIMPLRSMVVEESSRWSSYEEPTLVVMSLADVYHNNDKLANE